MRGGAERGPVKVSWRGKVVSVQARSTVWRYLVDNRTHREVGYNVFIGGEARPLGEDGVMPARKPNAKYDFCVAISEKQADKLGARIGDELSGTAWTPMHPETEFADFYRAGALKKLGSAPEGSSPAPPVVLDHDNACYDGTPIPRVDSSACPGPPWTFAAPPLEVYSWRGARMLSRSLWNGRCFGCVWAAMSNVTVQYDFDRGTVRNRFEAFCYGPLSCPLHKPGPARAVPYKGVSDVKDEGWLDDICTEWRASADE